ncbi:MAG: MoaD/ThiS family protein [Deltaproteobacteria bacterium]|nr:MoaD/ThiS family protein [Deltaproteobacteria bacterium]
MIKVKLRLFGRFRSFYSDPFLEIQVPSGSDLTTVKTFLASSLRKIASEFDSQLLEDAAFADEDTILERDARFSRDCEIAVLPPVCGG